MSYDPDRHHRRSIRLKGYDYSRAVAYFVTICTQGAECLWGEIVDGEMRLNDAGRMVQTVWDELPDQYPGVDIDEFVIMPNHVHGIIILTGDMVGATPYDDLVGATPRGRPDGPAPTDIGTPGDAVGATPRGCPDGQAQGPAPTGGLSLPDVVHRFKSFTTALYRKGVMQAGWPPFPGRLWQRNYYEHIIRTDESLHRIRAYIETNPERWALDRENPARTGPYDCDWIESEVNHEL